MFETISTSLVELFSRHGIEVLLAMMLIVETVNLGLRIIDRNSPISEQIHKLELISEKQSSLVKLLTLNRRYDNYTFVEEEQEQLRDPWTRRLGGGRKGTEVSSEMHEYLQELAERERVAPTFTENNDAGIERLREHVKSLKNLPRMEIF